MPIYFDYAATSPVCPQAVQAASEALSNCFGNPSSGYAIGRQAAAAVKQGRADVAAAVGCAPAELFFTSCGTEGDNWALRGAAGAMRRRGKHIITTSVEHAAVLNTADFLEKEEGFEVTYLKPDKAGHISPADFSAALRADTILVSMMLVNNETGAIFPVAECARLAKAYHKEILVHTDAVQGFCHVPSDPKTLGVDLLSISGHKIGAPKGIGALYIKKEIQGKMKQLLYGGEQEEGRRPGTEPTAQIAAFAAACRQAGTWRETMEQVRNVKKYALEKLKEKVPGLIVVSPGDAPHICAISLPGYPSQMVMNDLDARGICVSNGSACHKGKPSYVFAQLGLAPQVQRGMLRISFSPASTRQEIDVLSDALAEITAQRMPMMKG